MIVHTETPKEFTDKTWELINWVWQGFKVEKFIFKHQLPTDNKIVGGKNWVIPFMVRQDNEWRLVSPLLLNIILEALASTVRQERRLQRNLKNKHSASSDLT